MIPHRPYPPEREPYETDEENAERWAEYRRQMEEYEYACDEQVTRDKERRYEERD